MRRLRIAIAAGLAVLALAAPVQAITFGHLDGTAHPNVGAMVVLNSQGKPDVWCTGSLVSAWVFVTASHCTIALGENGISDHDVYVSFDPVIDDSATLHRGTAHTNPLYGHSESDPHDVAVIVLDEPIWNIPFVQLPTAGLLDQLALKNQRFTAVGYGTVRDDKTKGPQTFTFDATRRWVDQGFRSVTKAWLNLNMNPSTGSGGTCYGDSGGPHFLGSSQVEVALTVTGDSPCRATDVDYRLDTSSARSFLAAFVALP